MFGKKEKDIRLPVGKLLKKVHNAEISDILFNVHRAREVEFSGYFKLFVRDTGAIVKILILEGAPVACSMVSGSSVSNSPEKIFNSLKDVLFDVEVYEFDDIDTMLARDLNRSVIQDGSGGKLRTLFKSMLQREAPPPEQQARQTKKPASSRDELMKKYRLRDPSDEEIERLIRNAF